MWVICLSAEQTADKELIQRLSRSLIQVCKDRPVLLLRMPIYKDEICDPLQTKTHGRFIGSFLNEQGIAVVNVEGTDRQLLYLKNGGELYSDSLNWVLNLLEKGVLVSLSLLASRDDVSAEANIQLLLSLLKKEGTIVDAVIFMNKSQKRQVLVDEVPVEKLKWSHEALNSRVLDENIKDSMAELSDFSVYITSPIALLSKNLDKSTSISFP